MTVRKRFSSDAARCVDARDLPTQATVGLCDETKTGG